MADPLLPRSTAPLAQASLLPLPWHVGESFDHEPFKAVRDEGGNIIADACTVEEAAYIVTACNAYPQLIADRDALLEALREQLSCHDEKAQAYNFPRCGCQDCVPIRDLVSRLSGKG